MGNQVDPNIESESDASSVSDCPSWICEDLEGPNDDDIFTIRPPDHGKKLLKAMRTFLKDQKRKRRAKQQEEQFYERNFNNDTEDWCSDVNDDDELRSLMGRDDDSEVYEVWNDDMERRKVDLFVGLKFETRNVTTPNLGCVMAMPPSPKDSKTRSPELKSL